jgi:hypothetical protein
VQLTIDADNYELFVHKMNHFRNLGLQRARATAGKGKAVAKDSKAAARERPDQIPEGDEGVAEGEGEGEEEAEGSQEGSEAEAEQGDEEGEGPEAQGAAAAEHNGDANGDGNDAAAHANDPIPDEYNAVWPMLLWKGGVSWFPVMILLSLLTFSLLAGGLPRSQGAVQRQAHQGAPRYLASYSGYYLPAAVPPTRSAKSSKMT